ncbi:hypothetical protein [Pleionea mediterranea]|uniref:Uncharacterized protein n=1 Tax=Pleionea mediterranea TaxID=523701 RepID=A0A316FWG8_9GAMM|nr:hypothetical protein [Pleionea mediterranea]PWK52899.1 hypothetical protein C8D97_104117 [Pleionea mediterranea]
MSKPFNNICPKCKYQRSATDTAPEWQCPKCGIAYSKFQTRVYTKQQIKEANKKWIAKVNGARNRENAIFKTRVLMMFAGVFIVLLHPDCNSGIRLVISLCIMAFMSWKLIQTMKEHGFYIGSVGETRSMSDHPISFKVEYFGGVFLTLLFTFGAISAAVDLLF